MNENKLKILPMLVSLRKRYEPLSIVRLQLDMEQSFLAASVDATAIEVDSISVEDFQNGFEGHQESDWTISFD